MADPRDIYGYYKQKQFEEFMAALGKGAGLQGLAGDIPQGWEPPPMPPDPLRDFEWMPRRGFFLGFDDSEGNNSYVSDIVLPSMGADSVDVTYRVYDVDNVVGSSEPKLQIQTAGDPSNPVSWSTIGTPATFTANTKGTTGAISISSGIGRFLRWRVYLPESAGQTAYVELQASGTINTPYPR